MGQISRISSETIESSRRDIFLWRAVRAESQSKIDYFTVTVVELQMQVGRLFMTHLLPRFGIMHSMAYQIIAFRQGYRRQWYSIEE